MPIFVSYSHDNEDLSDELRRKLQEDRGLEVWNHVKMIVGRDLNEQLRRAIDNCSLCVFLATKESLKSDWCMAEIGAFWGAGKQVLIYTPPTDQGVDQRDMPEPFQGKLWTSDLDQLLRSLETEMFPNGRLGTEGADVLAVLSEDVRDGQSNQRILTALKETKDESRFQTLTSFSKLDQDDLREVSGLFLSMPYKQHFADSWIRRIVQWVRDGGRLVICGYELGPWHHLSDVNRLATHFGMQFRSDVVVGRTGNKGLGKEYGVPQRFEAFPGKHPILEGVSSVVLTNACSLYLEPASQPLILARPNRIRGIDPDSVSYRAVDDGRFELQDPKHGYTDPVVIEDRAVMAAAPPGLAGRGSAIAIGTWDFYGDAGDNDRFLANLFGWLLEGRGD